MFKVRVGLNIYKKPRAALDESFIFATSVFLGFFGAKGKLAGAIFGVGAGNMSIQDGRITFDFYGGGRNASASIITSLFGLPPIISDIVKKA